MTTKLECPECEGDGILFGKACANCAGTGTRVGVDIVELLINLAHGWTKDEDVSGWDARLVAIYRRDARVLLDRIAGKEVTPCPS